MSKPKVSKLEKLRMKLDESETKRAELTETIKQIERQISEEESKEFKSALTTINLSFEDAIAFLKAQTNPVTTSEESMVSEQTHSEEGKVGDHGSI